MTDSGFPSEELRSRILRAVRRSPAPTRSQAAGPRAARAVVALVAPVVGLFLAGGPNVGPRPASLLFATAGGGLALACATIWLTVGRGAPMLDRTRAWFVSVALLMPPGWLAWKLVWSAQFDGMTSPWAGRPGLRCFGLSLAFAVLPLLLFALTRRESDPTHPISRGAALGVAAGVYAGTMVDLWCPIGDLRHVLLGHALPVAILGLLGMWVGHRLLAIRGR